MAPKFSTNSTQQAVKLLRLPVRTAADEKGFALVLAMCMLSLCTLIGMAAMNTSVYEVEISKNEVIGRRTFTYAMSAVPLAALPIEIKKGEGGWPANNWVLEDSNNYIKILHKDFLDEKADLDSKNHTGWNNWDKWNYATTADKKTDFKPIDDIKGTGDVTSPTDCSKIENIEKCADIQIGRVNDDGTPATGWEDADGNWTPGTLFTMLVDVDRQDPKLAKGENTAYGEDAKTKVNYIMDCKATLPGRDVNGDTVPISEVVVGYVYMSGGTF